MSKRFKNTLLIQMEALIQMRKALLSGAQCLDQRNRCKLEHRRLPLNIRKHICAAQVSERWQRLPKIESLSLEIFKSHLDAVLGTALLEQRIGPNGLQESLPASASL